MFEFQNSCNITETLKGFINEEELNMVSNAIASHMGEWNTNKRSSTTLPKPSDKIGKFVHMCDYLASRKDIEVLFDEEEQAPPIDINTYKNESQNINELYE